MNDLIFHLKRWCVPVKACCCGHGKYPMTIVIEDNYGEFWEIIHNKQIPRSRNFYKKDKQGMYFIPEVMK